MGANLPNFSGTTPIIWLPSELGSKFSEFADTLSAYAAIRWIGCSRENLDPDVINVNYHAILSGGEG